MISLRPTRLRSRLTLWYSAMLATVLGVYLAAVLVLVFWQMGNVVTRLAMEDLETIKGLLFFNNDGELDLREDYHHHSYWKQVEERLIEVLAPNGKILYRNDRLGNRTIDGPPFAGEGERGYSPRSARLSDRTTVILVSQKYELHGQAILIRVAYSQGLIWSRLKETLAILLLALPLALAVTAFTGYRMAGRALAPIQKMAHRAEQINSQRLNERLPVEHEGDELGHLARVFNQALSRIEQSFEQLRRFTSDASHELRTPLAAIRSVGEVGLHKDTCAGEYRDTIGIMLEEASRLTSIVDSLLTLSRADAGQIVMQVSVYPVMDLMREAAGLLEVLIEERRLTFTLAGKESACVRTDRLYLRLALVNILHNAVKFTPVGGEIAARVDCEDDSWVVLSVSDTGPGIPPEHAVKVFERFYRVDQARGGDNQGAGLGLSIARWAVQANGGEIGLTNSPGQGCTFWIRLPFASCAASGESLTLTNSDSQRRLAKAGQPGVGSPRQAQS